ncbi:MAG: OmpA family protein, partial [Paracoccaceae bacterium]
RFDACSAGSEEGRERILRAAGAAGLEGAAECRIGLGVPSATWPEAVELALAALAELGGASVTFSDADITLIAPEDTSQALFDRVMGDLEATLPDIFSLHAVLPRPEADSGSSSPPEFIATRSPEGLVQLRGRLRSETARTLADSFARARFGSEAVHTAARIEESLPESWQIRVLAGLDALAQLSNGAVLVTSDTVTVTGDTGNAEASDEIARLLAEKLGEAEDFSIDVAYREDLDPLAAKPTPEECEAQIAAILEERKINFEPGSATPDSAARLILDDLADILKECGQIRLEIGGHTDSQGRETMNQELSQARAQAVLNALRDRRVLTSSFTAKGYGETRPIADNDTEEGREANRRIEFRLIRPEPLAETLTTLESLAEEGEEDEGTEARESGDEQN